MNWKKLGLIYPINTNKIRHHKLLTHAANPVAIKIGDNSIYRVFYSGRDAYNRSSIGAVDIDFENLKIVKDFYNPFFVFKENSPFFSHGVSIGDFQEINDTKYIFFMGWQIPPNSHWRGDIGRLKITNKNSLKLVDENPILKIDQIDQISFSYPSLIKHNGVFNMFYGSTISWGSINGEMIHVINRATSEDGKNWQKRGLAIPYEVGKAQAFSRPTILKNPNSTFTMWFSYRSGNNELYKIGTAYSDDLEKWHINLDSNIIKTSKKGWDSEMVEYPFVFKDKEKTYMLYNGNSFGKDGFGLAIHK